MSYCDRVALLVLGQLSLLTPTILVFIHACRPYYCTLVISLDMCMVMVMVMLNQVQVFHDRLTYTVVITNNSGQGENTFYCIILCSFSGPLLSIKYQKTQVTLCTLHIVQSAHFLALKHSKDLKS